MSPQAAVRFLIGLLVLGIVLYCVYLVLMMLQLPSPFHTIILCIIALIALGFLLNWTGMWPGNSPPPP
jgi:hypothetical protein